MKEFLVIEERNEICFRVNDIVATMAKRCVLRAGIQAIPGLAMLLLSATSAWAGPPYVTDDPEPTDPGKWEIYGFTAGSGTPGAFSGDAGFDINYGAAKDLQASAVIATVYDREPAQPIRTDIANTEIGLKYCFIHQHDVSWLPDVSLFPKLELPTAGRRFGSGKTGFQIPLWAQKDIGAWSLFGGGGYALNPGTGNRNFGFAGAALTRQVGKAIALGGEIYRQSADSVAGHASTGLGLGVNWQIAPHWSVLGSGGPITGHDRRPGSYMGYIAFEFHN